MKLTFSETIKNKLDYFLHRFDNTEWSAPAWYLAEEVDENKFPVKFQLLDFHPLDLGGHASTEWEAGDLAKILKEKYKENKELKKCFIGLVHSHHNMGAYFSGTDQDTLKEMAPDTGFYPSLVVSHKSGKEYAFGVSYSDQYKRVSLVEGEVKVPKKKGATEWIAIGDKLEKDKQSTSIVKYRGSYGQSALFGYGHYDSWADNTDEIDEEVMKKGEEIWSRYRNPKDRKADYQFMSKSMQKLGISHPHAMFSGSGVRY